MTSLMKLTYQVGHCGAQRVADETYLPQPPFQLQRLLHGVQTL